MKIFCVAVACIFLTFISQGAFAQKNLLTNGGFEDELFGWNSNGGRLTPWDYKSGKNSCVIIAPNSSSWVGIDQTIKIPKKVQAIEFTAWLKTANVVKGKDDWNGAVYTVVFMDLQDKELGTGVNIIKLTCDNPWQLVKKVIKIPERAVSLKVLLAMGNASGSMLIDDVVARPLTADEMAKL